MLREMCPTSRKVWYHNIVEIMLVELPRIHTKQLLMGVYTNKPWVIRGKS